MVRVGTCAPCSAQYSQELCDPYVGCNWNGTECNPVTTESCPERYCSSAALFEATETDAKLLAVHIAVSGGHVDAFEHGWYTDCVSNAARTSSFRSCIPLGFSDVFEDCKTLYQYTMGNYFNVTGFAVLFTG